MKRIVIAILKVYQVIISPFLGPSCRFTPTCSSYWIEGVKRKGIVKGFYLGTKRILRCHPFHQGGYDPI